MGMFDDLIPSGGSDAELRQSAGVPSAGRFASPQVLQTKARPAGMFDDLIPATPQDVARQQVAAEPDLGAKPLAFGLPIVGPFLDEGAAYVASLPNRFTGGAVGPTYEQSLNRMRARNERAERDYPILDPVGQIATGLVTGGAALSKMPMAATYAGKVLQGAGLGGYVGAIEGFGRGEGDAQKRLESAETGARWGAGIGGAIPAIAPVVAPVVGRLADASSVGWARLFPNARLNPMLSKIEPVPRSGGAAAAPPMMMPPVNSADAAGEQLIANQLARANVSVTDLRQRLAEARSAAGEQTVPSGLVDLDQSLAQLAGSVKRQLPEAGNMARSFFYGRQTGETPIAGMPSALGIPTRAPFTPAVPGQQMGQNERVREALREAMQIPRQSANQTAAQIEASLEAQARPIYRQTYQAAQGVDMVPVVQPLVNQWRTIAADQVDEMVSRPLNAAIKTVERALAGGRTPHFERLNAAKISMDEMIYRAMRSDDRRSPALAARLTEIKNQLLDAMDQVPNVGPMYNQARAIYSGHRQMQEALEFGRSAFRDGSEATAQQYNALTQGQQQVARIGVFDSFDQNIANSKKTADITQVFESPRIQEILQSVMPYASMPSTRRPIAENFGRFIQTEKSYVGSKNEVLGGSPTQGRAVDDEATNQMQGLIENLRQTRSVREAAFAATQAILDKLFGYRADTAASAARQLFTANPRNLEVILQRLETRLGPNRAEQFRSLMQQYSASVSQSAGNASTSNAPPTRQPPPAPKPRPQDR